jgi:hypothetical protein
MEHYAVQPQYAVWHLMGRGMGVQRMPLVEGLGVGLCYLLPVLCLPRDENSRWDFKPERLFSQSHELTGYPQGRDWWELKSLTPLPNPS